MPAAKRHSGRRPAGFATVAEACWFLRICRATLDRWERKGLLKRVKRLGRMVRYPWHDLHRLANGGR